MTGKFHFTMNVATAAAAVDTYFLMTGPEAPEVLDSAATSAAGFLFDNGNLPIFLFGPLVIFLYLLGSLLPDVDHPYSVLGKVVHVPVKHRTWLHAIYLPAILLVAGIWARPVFWLGLGTFFHLFWDSFSRSGINWFYPHRNAHHVMKLYHTGKTSEYVFVLLNCGAAVIYTAATVYLRSGFFGLLD